MIHSESIELTILMPCLNEEETLSICIDKAISFLSRNKISGEVLIADNGSTDKSVAIAKSLNARVVHIPEKGYGAALQGGIQEARGKYVIMGDADDSYDFSSLELYIEKLREGYELVMGNRFKGGITPGAMPFLHKYLGNPVLSWIGKIFFKIPVGDFHCGLRGFNRESILKLSLSTTGMEFASEMVVQSALNNLSITEIPTTLSPDGRTRPPHLNTWRDGWRHLRFLLLFSPRWLFFYPSLFIILFGGVLTLVLAPGSVAITPTITIDIHTMTVACFTLLVGVQGISFAIVARRYAAVAGFLPLKKNIQPFLEKFTLERILLFTTILFTGGISGFVYCIVYWLSVNLGPLEYGHLIRTLLVSGTTVVIAVQLTFTSFLAEIMGIGITKPHCQRSE